MDIMPLLEGCRTYRRFAQKPVPQDVIDDIVKALRFSSSARNGQPIRLLLIQQPEAVDAVFSHVKWAGALPPELGTPKPDERPTLFVAVLDNGPGQHDTDAGIAVANMTLAAWAHGVGSCIMQAIDRPALTRLLHLPETQYLHSILAFGYPTHQSTLVPVPEDGSLTYYLDDRKDYFVPRYCEETLAQDFHF